MVAGECRSLASASPKTKRTSMTLEKNHRVIRATCRLLGLGALVLGNVWLNPAVVHAEDGPGSGGISPNKLWVNAILGQPADGGGGGGGGLASGRALRYIRL